MTLYERLRRLSVGTPQTFAHITVFPLFGLMDESLPYLPLSTALKQGLLKIAEKSDAGVVPEVEVNNGADVPVLLLDGEELAGAKQNRVVSSTVLLAPGSHTSISVNCSERGRWNYSTRNFSDSGLVLPRGIRARRSSSVTSSLREGRGFRADQAEVWAGIEDLSKGAGVVSETDALRDVYAAKVNDLVEVVRELPCLQDQCGLVVAVDGAVVGLEVVSRPEAYAAVHEKLIGSYTIEVLAAAVERPKSEQRSVEQFLNDVAACTEEEFPAVGLGTAVRYEGLDIRGSALIQEGTCVHAAFFAFAAE